MSDDGFEHFALTHDVYDPAAVVEAARVYGALLYVKILRTSPDETEIAVQLCKDEPPREGLVDEFLNHMLDLSVRRKLGAD